MDNRWLLLLTLLVVTAVFACHWPALTSQAILFDDEQYLVNNTSIPNPGWDSVARIIREVFNPSVAEGYYHPLPMISLMLDVARGGRLDNLRPFHTTNMILHAINMLLVIAIIFLLFREPWIAAAAGLLFGLHPLTVEPIAWIAARKAILSTTFALGSLLSYIAYTRRQGLAAYSLSMTLFVLALLSKPTTVPLPAFLMLLDFWPLRRFSRRSLIEKTPYIIIAILFTCIAIASHRQTGYLASPEQPAAVLMLIACYKIVFYLGTIAIPVHLSPCYVAPSPLNLSNPLLLGSAGILAVITIGILLTLRRTRAPSVCGLIFLAGLAPMLGFFSYSDWVFAFDNYLYLPIIAPLLLIAALLCQWRRRTTAPRAYQAILVFVVLAVAAVEAGLTRHYWTKWQNTRTLLTYMLDRTPDVPILHVCLGNALDRQENLVGAIRHYERALALQPDYPDAANDLALVLRKQRRFDEARSIYEQTLARHPHYVEARNNLAIVLLDLGKPDEAIAHFRMVIERRAEFPEAHNNLGLAFTKKRQWNQAAACYRQALQLKRDYPEARANLVNTLGHVADEYLRAGHIREAIPLYRQMLEVNPDSVTALNNLAWTLSTSPAPQPNEITEAVELGERLCRQTEYKYPAALDTLAAAYAAAGRYTEATQTARVGIERAIATSQPALADEMRDRLRLYESGKPYREPARL